MMKCTKTLRVLLLVSACASTVLARHRNENGCGPLEARRWGLLAGVGVAPGFFKNRGYEQRVVPAAGYTCPSTAVTLGPTGNANCTDFYLVYPNSANVFQQDACKLPKFNKLFTNGVLHVTGQISYNACSNVQYFLEGVYDRASGSCVERTSNNFRAPEYCSTSDCSSSCNTSSSCSSSSSCTVTGTPLSTGTATFSFSNYQAYGGYIGSRYYWNRIWCDRFAFFTGFKFGMLHRKQVCAAVNVPQVTSGNLVFAAQSYTVVPFCKSNAVSGGVQIGFDYCINDCWSVLMGVEFVATAPFKSNRNVALTIPDPAGTPTGFGRNFPLPTNVITAPTGSFLQFPVWAGIRWEFDWCKKACNEC